MGRGIIFIIFICVLMVLTSTILKTSYCMGDKQDMDNKFEIMDLVDKFALKNTDKIILKRGHILKK